MYIEHVPNTSANDAYRLPSEASVFMTFVNFAIY